MSKGFKLNFRKVKDETFTYILQNIIIEYFINYNMSDVKKCDSFYCLC